MVTLRSLSKPAVLVGALALSGLSATPALAYPPGVDVTISCSATTLAPGASFTCTIENIDPAGAYSITIGGAIADGTSFALASLAAQDTNTFTETLTAPTTPGTYPVTGTDGTDSATTNITVAESGGGGGTTPTTPKTGANVTLGLVAGLGALGLGGGLYAASRRKKI